MAAKAAEESKELAKVQSAELTEDVLAELAEDAGAGTSSSADDNVIPFLSLLQDLSPEAKSRDPEYVDGAKPGMILNKANKRIYSVEKSPADGGDTLEFQHCAFQRRVVEWVPRDLGGGFVAHHDPRPGETIDQLLERIGKKVVDPKDTKGTKFIWKSKENPDNELRDTRYHYGNIIDADGSLFPAVLSFSSSGHTGSREWMTLMNNFKINVGGKLVTAPAWSKKYRIRTKLRSNNSGEWFVIYVEDAGIITDGAIRAAGKALFEAFSSGAIRADDGDGDSAAAGAGAGGDDIPV